MRHIYMPTELSLTCPKKKTPVALFIEALGLSGDAKNLLLLSQARAAKKGEQEPDQVTRGAFRPADLDALCRMVVIKHYSEQHRAALVEFFRALETEAARLDLHRWGRRYNVYLVWYALVQSREPRDSALDSYVAEQEILEILMSQGRAGSTLCAVLITEAIRKDIDARIDVEQETL